MSTDPPAEHEAVARVRAHAAAHGATLAVRRFPAGTRTAQDAASAIGCEVERIVKSLVFIADGHPVVVLCAGRDRVDLARVAASLGAAAVRRATADEVRAATGYVIGGVPPFAHASGCRVLVDRGLLVHREVWAAAGLPDAVFPIAPAELVRLAGGEAAAVAEEA